MPPIQIKIEMQPTGPGRSWVTLTSLNGNQLGHAEMLDRDIPEFVRACLSGWLSERLMVPER